MPAGGKGWWSDAVLERERKALAGDRMATLDVISMSRVMRKAVEAAANDRRSDGSIERMEVDAMLGIIDDEISRVEGSDG